MSSMWWRCCTWSRPLYYRPIALSVLPTQDNNWLKNTPKGVSASPSVSSNYLILNTYKTVSDSRTGLRSGEASDPKACSSHWQRQWNTNVWTATRRCPKSYGSPLCPALLPSMHCNGTAFLIFSRGSWQTVYPEAFISNKQNGKQKSSLVKQITAEPVGGK